MKPQSVIDQYAAALIDADIAALEASTNEDGGCCNFDQPVIEMKGWRQSDVDRINEKAGKKVIGDKMESRWFRGCRWLKLSLRGQGNNRTRTANAAYKKLKELNIPVNFYSAMD